MFAVVSTMPVANFTSIFREQKWINSILFPPQKNQKALDFHVLLPRVNSIKFKVFWYFQGEKKLKFALISSETWRWSLMVTDLRKCYWKLRWWQRIINGTVKMSFQFKSMSCWILIKRKTNCWDFLLQSYYSLYMHKNEPKYILNSILDYFRERKYRILSNHSGV